MGKGFSGDAAESQRWLAQLVLMAGVLVQEAAGPDQYTGTPAPCLPHPTFSLLNNSQFSNRTPSHCSSVPVTLHLPPSLLLFALPYHQAPRNPSPPLPLLPLLPSQLHLACLAAVNDSLKAFCARSQTLLGRVQHFTTASFSSQVSLWMFPS